MSQDIREYDLIQVDGQRGYAPNEAGKLSVTATVGPTTDDMDATRGVQLTLTSKEATAYGRLTEPQLHELVDVLLHRISPDCPPEATGNSARRKKISPDGKEAVQQAADTDATDYATRDALQQTNDELDALRARVDALEERLDSV